MSTSVIIKCDGCNKDMSSLSSSYILVQLVRGCRNEETRVWHYCHTCWQPIKTVMLSLAEKNPGTEKPSPVDRLGTVRNPMLPYEE